MIILAHKLRNVQGSGNNPQLATNSGGVTLLSISNGKRKLGGFNRIIFTSVINNYIISFSSFLNKVKVKMSGF